MLQLVLLGLMLFAIANGVNAEYCTMLDFSGAPKNILNTYNTDSNGNITSIQTITGYRICLEMPSPIFQPEHGSGGGGYSEERSVRIELPPGSYPNHRPDIVPRGSGSVELKCTIYDNDRVEHSQTMTPEEEHQFHKDARNFTTGQMNIQEYNATYSTYEATVGKAGIGSQPENYATPEAYMRNMSKTYSGYDYVLTGYLYVPIDARRVLTVSTSDIPPEECVRIFKSLNITEVEGTPDPNAIEKFKADRTAPIQKLGLLIQALKDNPDRTDSYVDNIMDSLISLSTSEGLEKQVVGSLTTMLLDENTTLPRRASIVNELVCLGLITKDASVTQPLKECSFKFGDEDGSIESAIEQVETVIKP